MILNAGILHNEKHPPEQWVRQFVEKVCIYKNRANSLSLSPNPFPSGRGYITGATAPRPSKDACSQPHKATARCSVTNGWRPVRGLRPKARMLWLLAKSFARCKTSRASNARHPFLSTIEVFRQTKAPTGTVGAKLTIFKITDLREQVLRKL